MAVSKPDKARELLTDKGFRTYSGHYLEVAKDGRGTVHIVWALRRSVVDPPMWDEVWHAVVRLKAPK